MKRRDTVTDEKPVRPQEEVVRKTSTVRWYFIILFVAVILLIILSYMIQQRRNADTIDSMTESHNQFSIEALQNIEDLQNANLQLTGQVGELKRERDDLQARVDALESELNEADGSENALMGDLDAAKQQNQALTELLNLQTAIIAGNKEDAATAASHVEALRGHLTAEQITLFETLKTQIDSEEDTND